MTTVVFLGDSITNGETLADPTLFYGHTTAAKLGWTSIQKGVGGTGYLNPGTSSGQFSDRLDADVIANAPDVVVVQGSTNDLWWPADDLQAAAISLYGRIRAALPSAVVYALGILLPASDSIATAYPAAIAAVKNAALTARVIYVDPLASGWLTGTGNNSAPTGDGNADVYCQLSYGNRVHPPQAGHDYLGTRLAFVIRPPSTGLAA